MYEVCSFETPIAASVNELLTELTSTCVDCLAVGTGRMEQKRVGVIPIAEATGKMQTGKARENLS